MRDLKLLQLMKDVHGITFSDNPCYYTDGNRLESKNALNYIPVQHLEPIIYENINPISGYIDLPFYSCDKECTPKNYKSEMFRTTFSMKIGENDGQSLVKFPEINCALQCMKHINDTEIEQQNKVLQPKANMVEPELDTHGTITGSCEDLDEGNFKSSYAKQLADSYQRRSTPIESMFASCAEDENTCEEITSNSTNNCEAKCDNLLKQVEKLTLKLARSEEDLTDARKEILSLKLESARLKAENRSLRAAESMIKSPIKCKESDKMSLTYTDCDTWSLQQKVLHLTNQLEKADVTRHAYESATAQLVKFLKTLTSTLTPLTNEEHITDSSNGSHTVSMLTDIEHTLKNNKFVFGKEKSFVRTNNLKNSFQSGICESKGGIKPKRHKSSNSFNSNSSSGNSVRKDLKRLAKRKSKVKLRKCESFCDLPSNHRLPRLIRTLSADGISEDDKLDKEQQKDKDILSSSKNKGFFSSLRNVFKIEGEKSLENSNKAKKKKKGFLSFSKRSKRNPSPVRTDNCPHSFQSSTFYVSYPTSEEETCPTTVQPLDSLASCVETDAHGLFDVPDIVRPSSELISGPKEISVTLSMMDLSLTDITGPSGYDRAKNISLPWEPLSDNMSRGRTHCMQVLWRKSRSSFREADTRLCFV